MSGNLGRKTQKMGARIAFSRLGRLEAPALLLLMGLGLSREAWPQSLIEALTRSGLQLILPDNRDSGASEHFHNWQPTSGQVIRGIARTLARQPVDAGYSLEDMAADMVGLLDELKLSRVHVAGISLGGMIAQVLACRAPNRVLSLTSISSAVGNPKTGFGRLRAVGGILAQNRLSERQKLRFWAYLSGPRFPLSDADRELVLRNSKEKSDPAAVGRQLLALLASGDRTEQVRAIRVPTLVLHGEADPLLPLAAGVETAKLIPHAEFRSVPGLGHALPEAVTSRYAEWLVRHVASSS